MNKRNVATTFFVKLVQELSAKKAILRELVQHPLQKRFGFILWFLGPYRIIPGTMWFQIVVSVFVYRPLYMRKTWQNVHKIMGVGVI